MKRIVYPLSSPGWGSGSQKDVLKKTWELPWELAPNARFLSSLLMSYPKSSPCTVWRVGSDDREPSTKQRRDTVKETKTTSSSCSYVFVASVQIRIVIY